MFKIYVGQWSLMENKAVINIEMYFIQTCENKYNIWYITIEFNSIL